MPRKAKPNPKEFDDAVINCFMNERTGRESTTQAERSEIAERWSAGDYNYHRTLAAEKKLLPIALLVASLIDIDHPLLVSPGRGLMYSGLECAVIVLEVMLKGMPVSQPIQSNSFNRQHVDGMVQLVEEMEHFKSATVEIIPSNSVNDFISR